jgi:carboxyl-terminal processing protease
MKTGNVRTFIVGIIILVLLIGTCSAGFVAGTVFSSPNLSIADIFKAKINPNDSPSTNGGDKQPIDLLFKPFWQAWDLVHSEYYEQPVNDVTLMRGAIKGMLDSLGDQHTSYIDPEQLTAFNAQITGEEYEGIGAWVDPNKDFLTIISPMPESPAEKAGLKSGDQIIAIDGVDMTGLDGELVRQKVIGPAGSSVRLTIRRSGLENTFDVTIVRAKIQSSNVMGRMLDNNVAYIRLLAFGDKKTLEDFRTTLQTLLDQKPNGLILDLRFNGGGLLESSIDVASEFIDKGVIAYEQYGDGTKKSFEARPGGIATKIPLVILINEGSASASEIVAGAIQDLGRGKLVGTKSYGKGSVQIWTDLVDEQGAVRITIAKWLTPNGRTIHGIGLEPDIIVPITDQDIQAGIDPQLNKAIDILTQP